MFPQNIEYIQFYFQTNVQMFMFSMVYSATSLSKFYKHGYQFICLGPQKLLSSFYYVSDAEYICKSFTSTHFWGQKVYFCHNIFHIILLWWSRRKTIFFPPVQLSTDNGPSASKLNIEGCSLC